MVVEGSLLSPPSSPLDESSVATKIAAIETAYEDDNKDAGFIYVGSGPTSHYLTQSSAFNLTGNRVVYRDWLYKSPAEMANTRSYAIGISADFIAAESYIISFQESVNFIGNGGVDWDYQQRWSGAPQYVKFADQTVLRAQQSGTMISVQPYPDPPAPLWPSYEQGKYRRITRRSPQNHGHPTAKYTHYLTAWSYRFAFPTAQTGNPNNYGF
jgi:hypothetical protein